MSGDTNKRQQPQPKTCFLTVREAAAELRVSEKHVRRLIDRGELVAYRFGAVIRIKQENLDAHVAARRVSVVYKKAIRSVITCSFVISTCALGTFVYLHESGTSIVYS